MLRNEAVKLIQKMTDEDKSDREQALYIINQDGAEPTYENIIKYTHKVRNIRRAHNISKASRVPVLRSAGIARWLSAKSF